MKLRVDGKVERAQGPAQQVLHHVHRGPLGGEPGHLLGRAPGGSGVEVVDQAARQTQVVEAGEGRGRDVRKPRREVVSYSAEEALKLELVETDRARVESTDLLLKVEEDRDGEVGGDEPPPLALGDPGGTRLGAELPFDRQRPTALGQRVTDDHKFGRGKLEWHGQISEEEARAETSRVTRTEPSNTPSQSPIAYGQAKRAIPSWGHFRSCTLFYAKDDSPPKGGVPKTRVLETCREIAGEHGQAVSQIRPDIGLRPKNTRSSFLDGVAPVENQLDASLAASLDSHGGETANDSTILAIISLPVDVDFLLVFKVFVSLSQLVLFSLHVRESWN